LLSAFTLPASGLTVKSQRDQSIQPAFAVKPHS
jgi:hypothetical protein